MQLDCSYITYNQWSSVARSGSKGHELPGQVGIIPDISNEVISIHETTFLREHRWRYTKMRLHFRTRMHPLRAVAARLAVA